MITLTQRATSHEPGTPMPTVTLTCQQRTHTRLRARLDDGRDVGVILPRGSSLHPGDVLESEDGVCVRVAAANEAVSVVVCADWLLFARACYHLGNRHVQLQISDGKLAYSQDHVLDDMLVGLGLSVQHECIPFEPEPGAYGSSHHHHEH